MRHPRIIAGATAVCAVTVLAACQDDTVTNAGPDASFNAPQLSVSEGDAGVAEQLTSYMDGLNAKLAADGAGFRVAMVEYVMGGPNADEAGSTLVQKDVGNKQLGFDFVPGDTRRGWDADPNDITYAIDQTGDAVPPGGGLSAAQTDAAITRGMNTWDRVICSDLGLVRNPDFGIDIGVLAFSNGLGGSPFVFADVQHAGWLDIDFAGGVLGATFTFGFIDGSGNFTDVDANGKLDAAFREVYYDPSWVWADDGVSNIDVETVALHESGHGLSQAHFGNISIKNDGSFAGNPRAVMNAFIFGVDRELYGTDEGGHCSNWAEWPIN